MRRDLGKSLSARVVIGLMIVGFGLALMLDNLHIMEAGDLIRYWPFGLVAVGLLKLLQDEEKSSKISGAILLVVGFAFVAENFTSFHFHIWRLWPLAVIGFGLMILMRAFKGNEENRQGLGYGGGVSVGGGVTQAKGGGSMEQTLSEFAMWSGVQRRVASPAFRKAELTAIMGGIEIDLRQAGTENGEAVIDVFVMWGGIEITVPPDWAVSNQITPIMGGAEDKSTGTQASKNRLIVKGVVVMGGVDIKT